MNKLKIALLLAVAGCSLNATACYTVYDSANRVIYHSESPPVDMRLPLHQTLPRGAHMVFDAATACSANVAVAPTPARRPVAAAASGPLLTDPQTARSLGLPHTIASSGAAVVPAKTVARLDLPSFSVVEATPAAVATAGRAAPAQFMRDPTSVMGAGPAPSHLAMGASQAPAAAVASRGNETRDAPVTIIERGHDIVIRR